MYKLSNLVFLIILIGCSNSNNERTGIQLDSALIDSFYRSDRSNPSNKDLNFYVVDEFQVDLNNDSQPDKIILKNIKGYENDPGDFRQIQIQMSNGTSWTETNFSGWVQFDNNYMLRDNLKQQNQIDSDLILLTKFGETKLLGLFGWAYASEPGLLTLIEFSTGQPRIMVNKNFDIKDITSNTITVSDELETCRIELINGKIQRQCN